MRNAEWMRVTDFKANRTVIFPELSHWQNRGVGGTQNGTVRGTNLTSEETKGLNSLMKRVHELLGWQHTCENLQKQFIFFKLKFLNSARELLLCFASRALIQAITGL